MIYEFQLWACVLPSNLLVLPLPPLVSLRQTYQSPYLTKQTMTMSYPCQVTGRMLYL